MQSTFLAGLAGFALLATAGFASAQSTTTSATTTATTTTPTSAKLLATMYPTAVVRPGAQDTLTALIMLSGHESNADLQVSAIPLDVSFGGGATVGDISNCDVRHSSNLAGSLTSNLTVGLVEGRNALVLDTPLSVPRNSAISLALTCDVRSTAPSGGTALFSLPLATFSSTVTASGTTQVPVAVGDNPNGSAGATSGSVLISSSASAPNVPGVPNTGVGGSLTNMFVLMFSGLAFAVGATYALRARRA